MVMKTCFCCGRVVTQRSMYFPVILTPRNYGIYSCDSCEPLMIEGRNSRLYVLILQCENLPRMRDD